MRAGNKGPAMPAAGKTLPALLADPHDRQSLPAGSAGLAGQHRLHGAIIAGHVGRQRVQAMTTNHVGQQ